jgi:glycogen(starch) synthase
VREASNYYRPVAARYPRANASIITREFRRHLCHLSAPASNGHTVSVRVGAAMGSEARQEDKPTFGHPLRVLFVSREYPPETGGGGIGSYVEMMARALVARGHEVHVLSCVQGQADDDRVRAGVHLHRRSVHRFLPKIRRRLPSTALRIEGALSSYLASRSLGPDFDIVEAPDWMAEGLTFAVRRSSPLVVHLHTPLLLVGRHNPHSFQWSRDAKIAASLERFPVRRADLLTSPSRLLAGDLAREGWLHGRDPRIVRYPVDVEMWGSLPSPDSAPPRVLAVGRLEARKAPEVLVRAASLLSPALPDLEVVFVGRSGLRNGGEYKEWLVELAHELSAPCRFVEQVPRNELGEWYASARVVALASRHDNFPFAALEAMAAARPIVVTKGVGVAELLESEPGGAVVAVDDADGLAAALRPFLLDGGVAARAGEEARAVVSRHCSPERIAAEREACYLEAIRLWKQRRDGRRWRGHDDQ